MRRTVLLSVAAGVLLLGVPSAGAHTPITVEVIEPSEDEVVTTEVVRVSLRARSFEPGFTSTLVQIRIGDLWYDPAANKLVPDRPAFGGITINAEQTKQVRIEEVSAGPHVLSVSYAPHAGEPPVVVAVPFVVSEDAGAAKRRGSNYFLFAVAVLAAGALALQLSWRRRMSRS